MVANKETLRYGTGYYAPETGGGDGGLEASGRHSFLAWIRQLQRLYEQIQENRAHASTLKDTLRPIKEKFEKKNTLLSSWKMGQSESRVQDFMREAKRVSRVQQRFEQTPAPADDPNVMHEHVGTIKETKHQLRDAAIREKALDHLGAKHANEVANREKGKSWDALSNEEKSRLFSEVEQRVNEEIRAKEQADADNPQYLRDYQTERAEEVDKLTRQFETGEFDELEDLFEGVDLDSIPDGPEKEQIVRKFDEINERYFTEGNTAQRHMQNYQRELETLVERVRDTKTKDEVIRAQGMLDEVIQNERSEQRFRRGPKERLDPPNRMYLSKEHQLDLERNPIEFIERFTQQLETAIQRAGQESSQARAAQQILDQARDFLIDDSYINNRLLELEQRQRLQPGERIMPADKDEARKMLRRQIDKLLENSNSRVNASNFFERYSFLGKLGDRGGITERIQGMRENDFWALDGMYGGAVAATASLFDREAILLMNGEVPNEQSLTPEVIAKATEATINHLLRENGKVSEIIKDHFNGSIIKTETGDSYNLLAPPEAQQELTKDQIKSTARVITSLAATRQIMWMNRDLLGLRGAPPILDEVHTGKSTFETKLPVGRVMRWIQRSVEQFRNAGPRGRLQFAMLRNRARLWSEIHHSDVQPWAQERTEDLWRKLEQVRPLIKAEHRTVEQNNLYKRIKGEVQRAFFIDPDKEERNWDHFMLKISQRDVFEQMYINCGIVIADNYGPGAYSPLESGFRRGVVGRSIHAIAEQIYGAEYNENAFFTTHKVVDIAREFFGAKLGHKHHGDVEHRFFRELSISAKYRPHDFAEMIYDAGAQDLAHLPVRITGKSLYEMSTAVVEINQEIFYQLMNLEDRANASQYQPIDFSKNVYQWSDAQRTAVNAVFASYEGTNREMSKDEFITSMHELANYFSHHEGHGYQGGHGHHHGSEYPHMAIFASVKYQSMLQTTRWFDDIPPFLNNPDRFKFLTDEERGQIIRIGELTTAGGNEYNGIMKRAWMDAAVAEGVAMAMSKNFTNDLRTVTENIVQIYTDLHNTQGPEFATISALEQLYQVLASDKARPIGSIPFISGFLGNLNEERFNANDFAEYLGIKLPGKDLQELEHFWQDVQKHLGDLKGHATGFVMAEKMEELLGITGAWDKILGGHDGWLAKKLNSADPDGRGYQKFLDRLDKMFPSGVLAHKLGNAVLYMLIISAILLANQALQGEGGSNQGKGHH